MDERALTPPLRAAHCLFVLILVAAAAGPDRHPQYGNANAARCCCWPAAPGAGLWPRR